MTRANGCHDESAELEQIERPLSERERAVLEYLFAGEHAPAAAFRSQIASATVLQKSGCCASIHLVADEAVSVPAPTGGRAVSFIVQADWIGDPGRSVRFVSSADGWLSHVDLDHDREVHGPREFPPPAEFGPPVWVAFDWQTGNEDPVE